jgi:rRNA maturation RNase YbeY
LNEPHTNIECTSCADTNHTAFAGAGGDIVISLETLKTNAAYFHVDEDEELRRLIIHGILHLAGFDHPTNNPEEPMLVLQEKILSNGEKIQR